MQHIFSKGCLRFLSFDDTADEELTSAVRSLDTKLARRALLKGGAHPRGARDDASATAEELEAGRGATPTEGYVKRLNPPILALCAQPETARSIIAQRRMFEILTTPYDRVLDGEPGKIPQSQVADINVRQALTQRTPLMTAVISDNPGLLDLLLMAEPPADTTLVDDLGKTVLHHAAALGRERCLRTVLATPRVRADKRRRELSAAEHERKAAEAAVLVLRSDVAKAEDEEGGGGGGGASATEEEKAELAANLKAAEKQAERAAVRNREVEGLYQRAAERAERVPELVALCDSNGMTALKLACMDGRASAIRVLVQHHLPHTSAHGVGAAAGGGGGGGGGAVGRRKKATVVDNRSPLHYTVMFGHVEATQALLDAAFEDGKRMFDPNTRDKGGKTPLLSAKHNGDATLVDLLEKAIAGPMGTHTGQ
jgi:ankyrin repeat protein